MIGDVHVLPVSDIQTHIEAESCWCGPKRCFGTPRVIVHNAADGRDLQGWYEAPESSLVSEAPKAVASPENPETSKSQGGNRE